MNTNYFLSCVAGNIFHTRTSPAVPSSYYIGLSTTAPNTDGTGYSEPSSDAGYGRVKLTSLSEPADGLVTNTAAVSFAESTASWGTVTHFVIFDEAAVGSGNLLMYGTLSTPRTVEAETTILIKENYLRLSVTNAS